MTVVYRSWGIHFGQWLFANVIGETPKHYVLSPDCPECGVKKVRKRRCVVER